MTTRALPLTIACGNYDRTRPLFDGRVLIEGCDPTFLPLEPEEIFFRAFVHEEFDVAELSLSSYTMRRAAGDCPYAGIPAFLRRLDALGIGYSDLETRETSLEEIFVSLVGARA